MKPKYASFSALDPFFDVVQRGLSGGYGESIVLHGGDGLVVHRCDDGRVIVIEYEVHGRVVGSGAAYENRFVSIVTVENRTIVHWRDYMDSLSAMRALSTKI